MIRSHGVFYLHVGQRKPLQETGGGVKRVLCSGLPSLLLSSFNVFAACLSLLGLFRAAIISDLAQEVFCRNHSFTIFSLHLFQ